MSPNINGITMYKTLYLSAIYAIYYYIDVSIVLIRAYTWSCETNTAKVLVSISIQYYDILEKNVA